MGERGKGVLLALGTILATVLIAGVAVVLASSGTNGPDQLTGTPGADSINGGAGADIIKGLGGNDVLTGGTGFDLIYGGPGNDRIQARDGEVDYIDCGPGADTAIVDRAEDGVYDCERVAVPTS